MSAMHIMYAYICLYCVICVIFYYRNKEYMNKNARKQKFSNKSKHYFICIHLKPLNPLNPVEPTISFNHMK